MTGPGVSSGESQNLTSTSLLERARGQDKQAPGQAEDKGSGAAEKQSGPVEKIVEKGVDPTADRLGRTMGNVADRD